MDQQQARQLLTDLFESWYPSLLRYAYRISGRLDGAQDDVQEAFLLLYRSLVRGVVIENPKAWTLKVTRRQSTKRNRISREEGLHIPLDDAGNAPELSAPPDLDALLFGDVLQSFRVLSAREEEVLILRMESLKYREIAARLGISANSVTTLLSRALKKLRVAAARMPDTSDAREDHVRKTL